MKENKIWTWPGVEMFVSRRVLDGELPLKDLFNDQSVEDPSM